MKSGSQLGQFFRDHYRRIGIKPAVVLYHHGYFSICGVRDCFHSLIGEFKTGFINVIIIWAEDIKF